MADRTERLAEFLPAVHTHNLCGVALAPVTLQQVVDTVERVIAGGGQLRIGVVNAAKIVTMQRDPQLREDVVSCDLVVADGMSIVWASRLLGAPLPERVAGIDLMHAVLASGNRLGYRVYCLGATREVLHRTITVLARDYPGVQLVGWRDGYYSDEEEPEVAAAVAAARPDVLFVAMSSPRKEAFMARWGNRLGVPVCHGVGGSFDVVSGVIQRAPLLWQRAGLEWLYRVKQEPRRLGKRYLMTNSRFIKMIGKELVKRALRPAE